MILGIRAIRHVPNRKVSAGALAMGMANFVHAELAAAGSSAGTGFYVSGGAEEAETFTEQNDNNTIWQGKLPQCHQYIVSALWLSVHC